jgi:hypothetical protein
MEWWNDGILGSGRMDHWSIGKNPFDREVNKWKNFLLKSTFHYSRCEAETHASIRLYKFNKL